MDRKMWIASVRDFSQFSGYCEHFGNQSDFRLQVEKEMAPPPGESRTVDGYCGVCRKETRFLVDYAYCFTKSDGGQWPNFRERLECDYCHLNTRMRGVMQFIEEAAGIGPSHSVYATEMMTPLYKALELRLPNLIGSEYLQSDVPLGARNAAGIRNEDGTRLTFADASFDCIVSLDVMEHIPDYSLALQEIERCLKPLGKLILTAPFDLSNFLHVERAKVINGEIFHILPPEYHGDPLNTGGVLCFRHFGWSLLDELRSIGFVDVSMNFYWSRELGHIGGLPFVIMAVKPD